ncbi:MAG: hypothetical protein JKY48_01975 [Flavobacteriales bacterium]|nr:hypothetical protein [Flavobacteriales bacterium]
MKQIEIQSQSILSKRMTRGLAGQTGMATLMVTLILLIVSTLSALAVSRSAFFERKITGSDVRNKEVYAAAIAGLEYGTKWLEGHEEVWDIGTTGGTATPDALANTDQGADAYAHTITYTLLSDLDAAPTVIEVSSLATAVGDSQVQKTVKMIVLQSALLTRSIIDGPPLLVENCIPSGANIVGGTPNLVPATPTSAAIGTTAGDTSCLDEGHFDVFPDENLTNGTQLDPIVKTSTENDVGLWASVFGSLLESDIISMSIADPARVIYVDGNYANDGYYTGYTGSTWHDDVGSDHQTDGKYDDQVILYFDSSSNCPTINGGTVIHGLVYFETEGCTSNGWGGGTVYGTVAISGDLNKFNSNATLIDRDLDTFDDRNGFLMVISSVPGSWVDF